METKEQGYSFYRLDTGMIRTRIVFEQYDEYPEEVLMKLHSKHMKEMKEAVKLKKSKCEAVKLFTVWDKKKPVLFCIRNSFLTFWIFTTSKASQNPFFSHKNAPLFTSFPNQ